jgi:hypothetical protein
MVRWYRTFGVVLGVLLGLCWAETALAQCTQSGGLTLTAAGSASGFGLSAFACGFPSSSGPSGSVGTGAGNVLVTDSSQDDTVSLNPATCISDNGCNINSGSAGGQYSTFTNYTVGNIALGPVTSALSSSPGSGANPEFSVDISNFTLDKLPSNGASATNISGANLGGLSANEAYAVATLPTAVPEQADYQNFVNSGGAATCGGLPNDCYAANDLLALGHGGVYVYNGSSLTEVTPDSTGGLDALAVAPDGMYDMTEYVGSDTSSTNAITAYDFETGAIDFTVSQSAFGGGVTGLYNIQTGDLANELLVETADSVDLYCVTSNSYGCSAGEVVALATGGSGGGTIGSDFNLATTQCGGATNVDEYTCEETVYLSQSTTLDQLTYGGSQLVNPATGVPEPASLTLFGTGLAGLGFFRRRKAAA